MLALSLTEGGGAAAAVIAIIGLGTVVWKLIRSGVRNAAEVQRGIDWIRTQMEANGAAKDAGTQDSTFRDLQDKQMALIVELTKGQSRMDENQRTLGRKLGAQEQTIEDALALVHKHLADGHGGVA